MERNRTEAMTGARYRGFISYAHANSKWAKWVQKNLESYRLASHLRDKGRGGSRSLGRFFLDDTELGAAQDLEESIKDALRQSECLIVICSRAAAQSIWVNREIEHFSRINPDRPILSVIIGGDPNSTNPGDQCFPPALLSNANKEKSEPLAVNFTDGRHNTGLMKLVSGILEVRFDDLRQRRRGLKFQRRARILAPILVAPIMLFTFGQERFLEDLTDIYSKHFDFHDGYKSASVNFLPWSYGQSFGDCRQPGLQCPEMMLIPAAISSSDANESNGETTNFLNRPAHPYAISKFEVSLQLWNKCADLGPCPPIYTGENQQFPVAGISVELAQLYTQWLSETTGGDYRLPTDSEWSYAARAGSAGKYNWGDQKPICGEGSTNSANFLDCTDAIERKLQLAVTRDLIETSSAARTSTPSLMPIFSLDAYSRRNFSPRLVSFGTPNAFGLHNTHGNVSEIVSRNSGVDDTSIYVAVGGDWNTSADLLTLESSRTIRQEDPALGFRVVRVLEY